MGECDYVGEPGQTYPQGRLGKDRVSWRRPHGSRHMSQPRIKKKGNASLVPSAGGQRAQLTQVEKGQCTAP